MTAPSTGPLAGVRVVEFAGIGPAPFAAMLLADLGADVVRVDRRVVDPEPSGYRLDIVNRGKRSIALDLKAPDDAQTARRLIATADVLIEGFRPGVMERLGLGPDDCAALNPRLVYGRMTGWGQTGPLAGRAGHDIDYIAVTGALWAIGRKDERPTPPLNLLGDYSGGSLFLVVGILAALQERSVSGHGQVIDAAMVDGVSVLTTMFSALRAMGLWSDERGSNFLDSGAPHYEVYECSDGRFFAVGALEPQFYAELVTLTGFRDGQPDELRFQQDPPASREAAKQEWAALFVTRTREEWTALLQDSDACAAPVLEWTEAPAHPQLAARGTFTHSGGVVQPAPAPRFSRSGATLGRVPPYPGEHTADIIAELDRLPRVTMEP
jgi:alpha-methylacyl-CoA racemase